MAESETSPKAPEQEQPETAEPVEFPNCPIVGFGASAGGLEAITEILHDIPDDLGMALVFIQHLDPNHSSMLSELLSRATSMPVQQATDGMHVEHNKVYVIAPNTSIAIRDGILHIEPRDTHAPHMPIDFFFRSLAEDQGSKAIGVVLSGTASDGTLGLKAIKEAGGITFAQDPETARYDGMPRSALVAGCVDATLSTKGIAAELVRLCRHPYLNHDSVLASAEPLQNEKAFEEILNLLRAAKGVDFKHYKPGTVRRRTLRRMAIHRLENPEQYARFLKQNRPEVDLLFNDLLIHVTSFFREAATFAALTKQVLPAILNRRSKDDPVRIWVPGCATGEEAYSVAITVLEYMRQENLEIAVQLFGTDLSDMALEQARSGVYPQSIEADVSAERLRRFFVMVNGMYQIARPVRDICVFARQNVTKDPPFSKLDLITCRNLLIYLGPRLQDKVLRLFHYALRPTGFLVLGNSESVGSADDLFSAADRQHKIFSRKPAPVLITNDFGAYDDADSREAERRRPVLPSPAESETRVDRVLLSRYTSPAVVIDSELRVLQFRGDTSEYLRNPPGSASLSLIKLARGGLAVEVRKLIHSPDIKGGQAKSKTIALFGDGPDSEVVLSVSSLQGPPESQYLLVFEKPDPKTEERGAKSTPPAGSVALAERVKELDAELSSTKRYLHSVIEEQEAATEELKSAHEEVQSSNEELQSTNEELITAKEELQSTNEELVTVNDEMQNRNADLQQVNNDLLNLLSSVSIPIIMLGNDLRIRRSTPHADKILNLLSTDIGRPVSDFRLKINVPDLVKLCHEVIDNLVPREHEVQDSEGRIYSMWIRPYRTVDNRIDGVVLALFDVTDRRLAADARYKRCFDNSRDALLIADFNTGEILDTNPAVTAMFGIPRPQLLGAKFWESSLFRNSVIRESLRGELQARDHARKIVRLPGQPGGSVMVEVDVLAWSYSDADRRFVQFSIRDLVAHERREQLT